MMLALLLASQNRASDGRSLGTHEVSPDNKRRSQYEEGSLLDAQHARSEYSCSAQLDQRRLDRGARRRAAGLIGRRSYRRHFANQGTEAARNQTLGTEAASGGSRYSASAFKGLPTQQADTQ